MERIQKQVRVDPAPLGRLALEQGVDARSAFDFDIAFIQSTSSIPLGACSFIRRRDEVELTSGEIVQPRDRLLECNVSPQARIPKAFLKFLLLHETWHMCRDILETPRQFRYNDPEFLQRLKRAGRIAQWGWAPATAAFAGLFVTPSESAQLALAGVTVVTGLVAAPGSVCAQMPHGVTWTCTPEEWRANRFALQNRSVPIVSSPVTEHP